LVACQNPAAAIRPLEWLGLAIWIAGLAGESVADRQLARFKADAQNRGRVCEAGLWRYSRHPNYFFEWTIWVAYATFALASPPWGYAALAMPALMLHFLFNVTGVRATEAQALRSKGEAYREYQRRTSAFVPLPRRD
jgi:steroid 5-alpha reductase family enzyme